MIEAYTGCPGSGKTSDAMRVIDEYLSRGRVVVSNIEIGKLRRSCHHGQYILLPYDGLNPDEFFRFAEMFPSREDQKLLVLDEAQLFLNSRSWDDESRSAWVRFFSQHRKLGFKIILITQNLDMVDRQIRVLVEYERLHRKASNFGIVGRLISTIFLLFVLIILFEVNCNFLPFFFL